MEKYREQRRKSFELPTNSDGDDIVRALQSTRWRHAGEMISVILVFWVLFLDIFLPTD